MADFEQLFERINGLDEPLRLICAESEFQRISAHEIGVLTEAMRRNAEDKIRDNLPGPYNTSRSFSNPSSPEEQTYETQLGIMPGHGAQILNDIASRIRGRALSVIDLGAGRGKAIDDICGLDCVDSSACVGISLPLEDQSALVYPKSILEIMPRIRFDVAFSVHGIIEYHPFNKRGESDPKFFESSPWMFAVLQYINFVRAGGYIFSRMIGIDEPAMQALEAREIIKPCTEFAEHHYENYDGSSTVFKVLRRPTADDIIALLTLKKKD